MKHTARTVVRRVLLFDVHVLLQDKQVGPVQKASLLRKIRKKLSQVESVVILSTGQLLQCMCFGPVH